MTSETETKDAPLVDEEEAGIASTQTSEPSSPTKPSPAAPKKYKLLGTILVFLALTALVVGLAVGLPKGKGNNNNNSNAALTSTSSSPQTNDTTTTTTTETSTHNSSSNNGNNGTPTVAAVTAQLSTIGPEVVVPYDSCAAFEADLTKAVRDLINTTIEQNIIYYYDWIKNCINCGGGGGGGIYYADGDGGTVLAAPAEGGNAGDNSGGNSGGRDSSTTESSYGTNNQVEGVDEADVVKSNGVYVFAVYGGEIVVLSVDNVTVVSRTSIPLPNITDYYYSNITLQATYPPSTEFPISSSGNDTVVGVDPGSTSGGSSGSAGTSSTTVSSTSSASSPKSDVSTADIRPGGGGGNGEPYTCSVNVLSLLLYGNRLVAITSGYCYVNWPWSGTYKTSILSDSGNTKVYVYDISSVPTDGRSPLTLINSVALTGYYKDARSIDANVHIVTTSYIDTYTSLLSVVNAWDDQFINMTASEYRTRANQLAAPLIPGFVSNLRRQVEEITGNTETTGAALCDNLVRLTSFQLSQANDASANQVLGFSSLLSQLLLVTSFNIDAVTSSSFSTHVSGLFQPSSYSSYIYLSGNYLLVPGIGWENDDGTFREVTFVFGFTLGDGTSQVDSIGHVPGYLLNQFSMNLATKNNKKYAYFATTSSAQWGIDSNGIWVQTSTSTNQLNVLQLPEPGAVDRTMTVVGSLTNLARTESIYSARFFGDFAYISTFRLIDPFYIIDLSDPTNPSVSGELLVSGYSSYLHPFADGAYILSVGQEADATTGAISGLKVVVFDVSDPTNPRVKQQYVTSPSASSVTYSSAQWDFKAFRHLEVSNKLIIPEQSYDTNYNNNFDGFAVYDIDLVNGISPSFRILHADNNQIVNGCWSSAYLQARSLVFSGNLMTLKGHTVLSHNLDTEQLTAPEVNLDLNQAQVTCGVYFAF